MNGHQPKSPRHFHELAVAKLARLTHREREQTLDVMTAQMFREHFERVLQQAVPPMQLHVA